MRLISCARSYPWTCTVICSGMVVRLILLPLYSGRDFTVLDLASRATLQGANIYAHHPAYPAGPYAYFPLVLYVELPLQWLALHAGVAFTVMGKMPIIAADLACSLAIIQMLPNRAGQDRRGATAAGLFLLNPLVLYNGAFYGRFDSIAMALLLLALRAQGGVRGPKPLTGSIAYALAVAAKTFPLLIIGWLVRHSQRLRLLATLTLAISLITLPYLLDSPEAVFTDVILYNANKHPSNLSWQVALLGRASPTVIRSIGVIVTGLGTAALLWATRVRDIWTYTLVALLLFLVTSPVVLEQYLTWPLPILIVRALHGRSRASGLILGLLTATGMLVNPYIHPLGEEPVLVAAALASISLLYALILVRSQPSLTDERASPPRRRG